MERIIFNGIQAYTDFVVHKNRNIVAVSIIGQEIAVKAFRAEFMDYTQRPSRYQFYDDEDDFIRTLIRLAGVRWQVFPQEKTEQGLQVLLMQENLLWGTNKEGMLVRAYQHLKELGIPCPTPNEPEFRECIGEILKMGIKVEYLLKCEVESENIQLQTARFYLIDPLEQDEFTRGAEIIVSTYIEGEQTPEQFAGGIAGVADYIERYAEPIGNKVSDRVQYLHMPGEYDKGFFDSIKRNLFPQQKDIAVAASKLLDKGRNALISGQMGVGKTTIGVTACHYHANKPYRAIITCPGHLVEKWAREVHAIIPDAKTFLFGVEHKPWQEFYSTWRYSEKVAEPEFWIVSNESLRSGYIQRPGFNIKKRRAYDVEHEIYRYMDVACCPKCGEALTYEKTVDKNVCLIEMTPADFTRHTEINHKCRSCGESLWQADNNRKGYRKISIADIIKKKLPKGFFSYYIADEVHKYKGSTAQGLAFGGVISKVDKVIGMTGTMADGYANGLYYMLWRMEPLKFKLQGFEHNEESRSKFQMEYGFWKKTFKSCESEYGGTSRAKSARTQVKLLPGYTINTFPEWLIEKTCFLKLSDVAPYLPPKKEFVNVVDMDDELAVEYDALESRLQSEIKEGGSQVASIMLHTCLSFPDMVEGQELIQVVKPDYNLYLPIPQMDRDKLYNKEVELTEILQAELAAGRKCLIFTTYTNIKDHIPRLEWVCNQVTGARVQSLRSTTVSTKKREAWVKNKLNNEGINTLICHPELVETGLDLLECPTIIWMQSGYIPATVRQASSRSWRIGQTEPVKVIFLCYRDTLQEKAFQLVGSKLNAAGILEGNLSNEGLRNFGQDEGMNDILSLLKDNIVAINSNDIFESYKAEVAELLSKPIMTQQESIRLLTLAETLAKNNVDLSELTNKQRKELEVNQDQLVLFA